MRSRDRKVVDVTGEATPVSDAALPVVIRRLTESKTEPRARARLLARLSALLAASSRQAGSVAVTTGRWLTDVVLDVAPHIPIRDLETLRRHHDGLAGDELADALIENSSRVTAGIGAGLGVLAAAQWQIPPTLLSAPVQIAAETVAVVAVELKLVGELHAVYGQVPPGSSSARAVAYLAAWSRRRGIDPTVDTGVLGEVISTTAKRQLRNRIVRRTGSSSATLLPFFAGAIAGGTLNAKATKRVGQLVAADLVRRRRR